MKKYLPFLFLAVFTGAQAEMVNQNSSQQAVVGGMPVTVRYTNELQSVPSSTTSMPQEAAVVRSRIPVKNITVDASGHAHLVGNVRGLDMDIYQFSANAGDSVRIISGHANAMEFAIFHPSMGMRFGNYQELPHNGVYELRIVNNRKNLAQDRKWHHYDVTFTLVPRGTEAATPVVTPVQKNNIQVSSDKTFYTAENNSKIHVQPENTSGKKAYRIIPHKE